MSVHRSVKNYPNHARHPFRATLFFGAGLMLGFGGCATSEPRYSYSHPGPTVVQDTYVYYPGYEIYYNSARRQYVYLEGNAWVVRRDPPRRWARDIRRAPSVRLDFNDSPERHHSEVAQRYPRNWNRSQPDGPYRRDDDRDGRR